MKNKRYLMCCVLILLVHVVLVLWFGSMKEGFHEDELYTYNTSSGQEKIRINHPYEWRNGAELQSKYFVDSGNRFDFKTVIRNQEEDVHPPLYYLCLNIFMSFFPGRFYKWFGIFLNLLFSLITMMGIFFLFYKIERGENRRLLSLAAGLSYAVSPSAISNIMMARMYVLSGMWIVLYTCLLVMAIQYLEKEGRKFCVITILSGLVCYCSFLTHYFCLLTAFFLTLFYSIYVYLILRRGTFRFSAYGFFVIVTIALAVKTYPASLRHMFQEYRGQSVLDGLANKDVFGLPSKFMPILNEAVFSGMMLPMLLFFIFSLVVIIALGSYQKNGKELINDYQLEAVLIISAACVFSIFVLSRTALLVGNGASRYFYPVFGLLIPVICFCGMKAVCFLGMRIKGGVSRLFMMLGMLFALLPSAIGLMTGNVLFLYTENKEAIEYSMEHAKYPAIVIFSSEKSYVCWYNADRYWPYEKVLLMDFSLIEADIEDFILQNAEQLTVYVDADESYMELFCENLPRLSTVHLIEHAPYTYVYELK